jgi:hypothetical protein
MNRFLRLKFVCLGTLSYLTSENVCGGVSFTLKDEATQVTYITKKILRLVLLIPWHALGCILLKKLQKD